MKPRRRQAAAPMVRSEKRGLYSSQVLDRVMAILGCFTPQAAELRFQELARHSGLHKSTLYRLLSAMREHQLIELDPRNGRYHPGLKLFELGTLAIGSPEIDRKARPILEWLTEQTGETSHLCVLDGPDVIYIVKVESRRTLRIPSAAGRRNPAYCTGVGKALLAFLPPERLEACIARTSFKALTSRTVAGAQELRAQLALFRRQGYSIDDREIDEDVRCLGAPVRDHAGAVVAAISIAGPITRMTKAKLPALARHVMLAAARISARLGYSGTDGAALSASA